MKGQTNEGRSSGVDADGLVSIVKGQVDPRLVTVYAVVLNEMFFLASFLEHYRKLGVGQFFFLDDRSDDGTREYITAQPDCILATSKYRYGEHVGRKRVVHLWKTEIPRRFLPDQWVVCADADEFLFLPPQFSTFGTFVEEMNRRGITAVPAAMVDFYPETIDRMQSLGTPRSSDELFDSYPYFDSGPYFRWQAPDEAPVLLHAGVQERLLRKFDISRRGERKKGFKRLVHRVRTAFSGKIYVKAGSKTKVPLVKWNRERRYISSHSLNEDPDRSILLPIAHFKFTSALPRKIETAIASKAYDDESRPYFEYADLLAAMKAGDGSFLCPRSVKFSGVADFARNGLLRYAKP